MTYYIDILTSGQWNDSVKSPCIPRVGEIVSTHKNTYKVLHVAYHYHSDDTLAGVKLVCEVIEEKK